MNTTTTAATAATATTPAAATASAPPSQPLTSASAALKSLRLPPNYGAKYSADFAALYSRVAKDSQSGLLPFFLKGVADRPDPTEWFQSDRIHPNEQAQQRMLDNVWPELKKLLK